MKTQFDLEQQILACWNVTSDIDTLFEGVMESDMTQDQIANALLGMHQLYELKFDKLFRTFEKLLAEQREKNETNHKREIDLDRTTDPNSDWSPC